MRRHGRHRHDARRRSRCPSGAIASRLGEFDDVAALEAATPGDVRRRDLIETILSVEERRRTTTTRTSRRFLERRREDRPAARPAALRRVPAQSVPGVGGEGADAGRQAGRGGGHQGLRRPADRRHLRAPTSSSARSCGPAIAASGRSRCAPASTPSTRAVYAGRDRADRHPDPQLVRGQLARPTISTRACRQIVAKSREGFVFTIDLQVQIHVPDTEAPRVICMVGTMPTWSTRCCRRPSATTSATSCRACRRSSSSRRASRCRQRRWTHIREQLTRVRGGDPRRLHPGRDLAARSWWRC